MDLPTSDEMVTARLASSGMSVIIVSRNGKGVQFKLDDVTVRKGRGAGGVRAIRLVGDDEEIKSCILQPSQRGTSTGDNFQSVRIMQIMPLHIKRSIAIEENCTLHGTTTYMLSIKTPTQFLWRNDCGPHFAYNHSSSMIGKYRSFRG